MSYHIVRPLIAKQDVFIEGYRTSKNEIDWTYRVIEGTPLSADDFDLVLTYSRGKSHFPDLLSGFGFVTSGALREVLEEIEPAHLQFLPVQILGPAGASTQQPYFLCNVMGTLDAIDWAGSDLEKYPSGKGISVLRRLALNGGLIGSRQIFRVKMVETEIIVSDVAKDRLISAKLQGIDFLPLEAYSFGEEW